MGLRIETNTGLLSILRNLQRATFGETRALERIATGLRINRAADNPAGLIIFETLRAELRAINQAVENTQLGINLLQTAEGALVQINERLTTARSLAIAAGNPLLGQEAQRALQTQLDINLQAINRLAQTTRFGEINLLDGNLAFNITNASPELVNIQVYGGIFEGETPVTIDVRVQTPATQAQIPGTIAAVQPEAVTFRIAGPLGTETITLPAGATQSQVEEAINALREYTGVEAQGGVIRSVEYGSRAFVYLENVEGELAGVTPGRYIGTDIVAQVEGAEVQGDANIINVVTPALTARIEVQAGVTGEFQFQISGGGVTFQINRGATIANRLILGIGPADIYRLGQTSGLGNLSTLQTGATNALLANPQNALSIIQAATQEVALQRGRIGSVVGRIFEPNIQALQGEFENLAIARSLVGEANIAEEIALQTRGMILREVGINLLRRSFLSAGLVLNLLR